ncbi:hypothetical protein A9Q75_13210 [Colwellia psychrerythraea]|uniref:Uncharacterized protein n=1 Tax=Colwellia psychrerythraea TaxID=28229 RepID=A0A1Y5EDI9_COLPS|nr:hypothetical protein A9Q75_13210 [Colwellia psychrerythraea]
MPNKKQLVDLVVTALSKQLQQAIDAANEAHAAAVDDQSVAETQYDTLAIEASYLAEGQSKRVIEFQHAIDAYKALELIELNSESYIALGALVQLSTDADTNHWFFIGPAAGGFRCQLAQKNITVITPKSPMGMALMGKQLDDDVEVMLGSNKLEDYIVTLK